VRNLPQALYPFLYTSMQNSEAYFVAKHLRDILCVFYDVIPLHAIYINTLVYCFVIYATIIIIMIKNQNAQNVLRQNCVTSKITHHATPRKGLRHSKKAMSSYCCLNDFCFINSCILFSDTWITFRFDMHVKRLTHIKKLKCSMQ